MFSLQDTQFTVIVASFCMNNFSFGRFQSFPSTTQAVTDRLQYIEHNKYDTVSIDKGKKS